MYGLAITRRRLFVHAETMLVRGVQYQGAHIEALGRLSASLCSQLQLHNQLGVSYILVYVLLIVVPSSLSMYCTYA